MCDLSKKYYQLADGQIWDISEAKWLDPVMAASEIENHAISETDIINLRSASGESDVHELIKTLEFYDFPVGELAVFSPKALKRELMALDDKYLTPRTLAGLAVGDKYAIAQWQEHEEKAKPLRARLEELENS